MRDSLGFSHHTKTLPILMVTLRYTRLLEILFCLYMSRPCWKSALCMLCHLICYCDRTLGWIYFLCRKKWFYRSWIVNPVNAYLQFTREVNKYLELPWNTLLPDILTQAMQETNVGMKCPLMDKYIVSGIYDHNGGVLTSIDMVSK